MRSDKDIVIEGAVDIEVCDFGVTRYYIEKEGAGRVYYPDQDSAVLHKTIARLVADNETLQHKLTKQTRKAEKYRALLCKWRNK